MQIVKELPNQCGAEGAALPHRDPGCTSSLRLSQDLHAHGAPAVVQTPQGTKTMETLRMGDKVDLRQKCAELT